MLLTFVNAKMLVNIFSLIKHFFQTFKSKLSDLKKLTNDLFERIKEHRNRPEALKALKDMLNISRVFLASASNMSEDEQIFTEVELKTLENLISDTQVRNILNL